MWVAWPLGAEGLEGQGRCPPEAVTEILEVERVVRNCCCPFRASEDTQVRGRGEDKGGLWWHEAGCRLSRSGAEGAKGTSGYGGGS